MKHLMLIGCSHLKNKDPRVMSAIERYNGGVYQIIKKKRREHKWSYDIDILIISAKYGLISEFTSIELYDQKMDKRRAIELQEGVSRQIDDILRNKKYHHIFVNLGRIYALSIAVSHEIERARHLGIFREASGGLGTRLSQTKRWIEEHYKHS